MGAYFSSRRFFIAGWLPGALERFASRDGQEIFG
jgi:hypothetical protein